MITVPLAFEHGHLFATTAEGTFLVDTGAPASFGRTGAILVGAQRFELPESFLGMTAQTVSALVGRDMDGFIGNDILARFDVLIDLPAARLVLSEDELAFPGIRARLEAVMGAPVLTARIAGREHPMFFDTGAHLSYFQDESRTRFERLGDSEDFYPGVGRFTTETYRVPVTLATVSFVLRCGFLPGLLGMMLGVAGVSGVIGNEILRDRAVGYFPRRGVLAIA